jgi:hypothetical protein
MLNAHPDLALPFESHFIVLFIEWSDQYELQGHFNSEKFVADLFRFWSFRRWKLSEADVRDALSCASPPSMPDAIRTVFALYASRRGKSRYGDKTPDYTFSLPFLARQFPEARFIHVIRDGRDVALALRDVSWMRQKEVIECALYWLTRVQAAERAGRWLGSHRYQEVRYEELVRDPKATLQRICEFLNLPFADSMLDYQASAAEIVGSEPNSSEFDTLRMPVTLGLRDWRTQMAPQDVEAFGRVAGDVLENLGYEVVRR